MNFVATRSLVSSSSRRCTLLQYTSPSRHSSHYTRPGPPPLPREQQREFEELQKVAQAPLSAGTKPSPKDVAEAELALHPDARKPLKSTFEGDVNPVTGEKGGPKIEPVGKWSSADDGDWSFKGRVSDF